MSRDKQRRKNVERCGRRVEAVKARGQQPDWRVRGLSVIRKGDKPLADMGDWVIDDAD
jgi:hypothetical protein